MADINLSMNEFKVLAALMDGEKYGLEIIDFVKNNAKTTIYLGSLYNVLNGLSKKGLVESRWGEESSKRGGNRRRYYSLTAHGEKHYTECQFAIIRLLGLQQSHSSLFQVAYIYINSIIASVFNRMFISRVPNA